MTQAMIMPKKYFFDNDGNPLAFGKVYTYQAGTTTPKATYTTEDGTVENANPVILNGEGYASIYIDGSYTIVVDDAQDNNIWTEPRVSSVSSQEWINCSAITRINANTVSISGDQTERFESGRRVRLTGSSFSYSSVQSSSFSSGVTTIILTESVVALDATEICSSIVGPESIVSVSTPVTHKTVAEMILDSNLRVGQVVGIEDYATGNNSGFLIGSIVEAGTGVDDGGTYITLGNGLQWRQNFQRDNIHPKLFGARGDGSDQTAQINNWFNSGKNLTVVPGTFAFSGAPLLKNALNDISVTAKSWDAKIVRLDKGDVIKITNSNRITISGLYVQGVKDFVVGAGGINLTDCTQFLIDRNYVTGSSRQGIKTERCTEGAISNNLVTNSFQDGIMVRTESRRVSVTGNTCWNNGDPEFSPPIGEGIHLFAVDDVTVTGNVCYDNKDHGLTLEGADFCTVTGNISSSNTVSGCSIAGESTRTGEGTRVSSNTFNANGSDGVVIAGVSDVDLSHNMIRNNGQRGVLIGISSAETQNRINVANNHILGNSDGGILENWNNADNRISGNKLVGSSGTGIVINRSGSNDTVVTENNLRGYTNKITDNGTRTIISRNPGFVTENSGTIEFNATSTAEFVNHGLDYTPSVAEISAIIISASTTNPVGAIRVYNPNSSQFTVGIEDAAGAGGVSMAWNVRRI